VSTDRDVTRIVRSWLEDGATALPDRVLDSVLDQLPMTSQRRSWWPAWRLREMNSFAKFAIAAAAVVVVAVVSINLLPGQSGIGGPGPTASPSPSPSPSSPASQPASASPMTYVEPTFLTAGTYAISPSGGNPGYTFTLPEGWESRFAVLWKGRNGPGEVAFGAWTVANVYTDPCHWQDSPLDPPVGPTVDDLAVAIASQAGRDASPVTDVTFGGYPAKRMEISIPAGLDVTTCDDGKFSTWLAVGENPTGADIPVVASVQLQGRTDVLYIVDVDGYRMVMDAWYLPGTPAADVTELENALDSIQIQP
jgi:hypothetical protein